MIPNGSVEQSVLHARIDELERRLAGLEHALSAPDASRNGAVGGAAGASPNGAVETAPDAAPSAGPQADPNGAGGRTNGAPTPEPADEGLEGARLVAIELLSSGYERQEVATYLRSTFAIEDPETVIDGASAAPG